MKSYMAIDQHGYTYHNLGNHPRKKLLDILYKSSAQKMYVDKIGGEHSGKSVHIGWIIGGLWLTVYEVKPMEVPR